MTYPVLQIWRGAFLLKRCQTYQRFLRWMIFSPERKVSQINHYQISSVDWFCIKYFGTTVLFYFYVFRHLPSSICSTVSARCPLIILDKYPKLKIIYPKNRGTSTDPSELLSFRFNFQLFSLFSLFSSFRLLPSALDHLLSDLCNLYSEFWPPISDI